MSSVVNSFLSFQCLLKFCHNPQTLPRFASGYFSSNWTVVEASAFTSCLKRKREILFFYFHIRTKVSSPLSNLDLIFYNPWGYRVVHKLSFSLISVPMINTITKCNSGEEMLCFSLQVIVHQQGSREKSTLTGNYRSFPNQKCKTCHTIFINSWRWISKISEGINFKSKSSHCLSNQS